MLRKNKFVQYLWVRVCMFIICIMSLVDGIVGVLTLGFVYPNFATRVAEYLIRFNYKYFQNIKYGKYDVLIER